MLQYILINETSAFIRENSKDMYVRMFKDSVKVKQTKTQKQLIILRSCYKQNRFVFQAFSPCRVFVLNAKVPSKVRNF